MELRYVCNLREKSGQLETGTRSSAYSMCFGTEGLIETNGALGSQKANWVRIGMPLRLRRG